jgi:hypothetical protein
LDYPSSEHVKKFGDFSYMLVELWLLRISKNYNGVSISTFNFIFFGYITYSQAPREGGGRSGTHVLVPQPLQAMDDLSWMI